MKKIINILFVSGLLVSCKPEKIKKEILPSFSADSVYLNSNLTYGLVSDIEGNEYSTIVIGNQVWMAENLRTSSYRNGDLITNVSGNEFWNDLETGAWAYYGNNSQYNKPLGKLYNWYVVEDSRGICPSGWHVPSKSEVETLNNYLKNINPFSNNTPKVNEALKSKGASYWLGDFGINSSGFSALPGGCRGVHGKFYGIREYGGWWTSSLFSDSYSNYDQPRYFYLNYQQYPDEVDYSYNDKRFGLCIRCLKD
jgi:uncharacterized protein (TIGR02145 family)